METRANYVLIGAFTLFGILGSLGLFLWLAKVEADRQYAYYDILFDSVSGLGEAGDVRYNGLLVGQVARLSLDDADPGKVRVRIEIDASTPVKTDTIVTLELQGITGISYVSLAGGSAGAKPVAAPPGGEVPVIAAQPSAVQSLFEGTPKLLAKAITLLEHVDEMAGPENRAAFGEILGNLASASGQLDSVLGNFAQLSAELSGVSAKLAEFSGQLDAVASGATTTLASADETMKSARVAIDRAQTVIDEMAATLQSARAVFDSANGVMTEQIPGLIADLRSTAGTVDTVVGDVGGKAGTLIDKIDTAGDAALARLTEARATMAKLDDAIDSATEMMRSIEQTSRDVDALVKGDGAALVADARRTFAAADQAISAANLIVVNDLPAIIADVRTAAAGVNSAVARVGTDISGVTGKLDGIAETAGTALSTATETFRTANEALARVSATMASADSALAAAQQTFTGANRIIDEDVGTIVADMRTSMASLNRALDQVSGDLPAITDEVRATLARAATLADSLDGIVNDNAGQIDAFMKSGLPQFVRFVQEGNKLLVNLQRLTDKIERDPARFLLGTQSPEFRR